MNEVEKQIDKMIMDTHNAQIQAAKGPLTYLIVSVTVGVVGFLLYQLMGVIFG